MRIIKVPNYQGPDRRNSIENRILWWIIGLITTILLTTAGSWMSYLNAGLNEVKTTISERGVRIAVLEQGFKELDARLIRIENKIDRLIYGLRSKNSEVERAS